MRSLRFSSHWRISLALLVAALPVWAQLSGGNSLTVVNSATLNSGEPLAPLTLASAFGEFQGVSAQGAAGAALPTTLGNAQVMVNGAAAPLLYVSSTQINFMIPADTDTGSAEVAVAVGGQSAGETTVAIEESSPALFVSNSGSGEQALALNSNGTQNAQSNPAQRGGRVTLFATGLGRSVSATQVGAMLRLNRLDAQTVSADPVIPALWRVQIAVPADATSGQAPAAIYAKGGDSNTVSIWIQ